jgi:4-hydroxy-2-oxoheptanedioate aldolase
LWGASNLAERLESRPVYRLFQPSDFFSVMRTNHVKAALRAGNSQVGTWLSLASPLAARFMARSGFHWLTLDMEHSSVHWETAASILGCIADAGGTPLVRVPSISHENAKRALDLGAFGVVFPMCNSVQLAELAVAACRYPPEGTRSVGGSLPCLNFSTSADEYYRRANQEILIVVQAEHVDAVERIDEILAVPGIDAVFVGPNDLSASMGLTPQMESHDPKYLAAIERIRAAASRHGVAPGIHVANAAAAQNRLEEGWRFIAISSELGFMNAAAAETVAKVLGDHGSTTSRY